MMIPFGEWTPDIDSVSAQGLTVAKNVLPSPDGYDAFKSIEGASAALNDTAIGAGLFVASDGTIRLFTGSSTKLYSLSGTAWTDVTKGTTYTTCTNWEFAQFGNRIIAVSLENAPQYYDIGTSTDFDDLPGTPPKAAHVAIVGDHVVMGNLNISSTAYYNWVAWSGFNASSLWTPNLSTMADQQELFGRGGKVQKIIGGAIGIIFQENCIRTMTPVGPPLIFRFDEVELSVGTPSPNSVVSEGANHFYYGHDGFRIYSIGGGSKVISDNKVTRWFQNECSDLASICGVNDRQAQRILWAFKSGGSSTFNRILIYDWSLNRWSYAEEDCQLLMEYATPGYTLDTLDSIVADIDAATTTFDSDIYKGGSISAGAMSSAGKAGAFTGAAKTATIETGELSGDSRLFVTELRPVVTGYSTISAQIASRSTLASQASFGSSLMINSAGKFTTRANARYHKFRLTLTGGFTRAAGLVVDAKPEGQR